MTELNNFKHFIYLYFKFYKITISILVFFCIFGIIFQYYITQKEKYHFSITKEINEVYYANFYRDYGIENELFLDYFDNFYKLLYIELLNKEKKLDSLFVNNQELKNIFLDNLKISFQPQKINIFVQFNDQMLFENRIFIQNAMHSYIGISLENLIVQVAEKLIKRLDSQIDFLNEFISSPKFLQNESSIDEISIMKYRLNSEYNDKILDYELLKLQCINVINDIKTNNIFINSYTYQSPTLKFNSNSFSDFIIGIIYSLFIGFIISFIFIFYIMNNKKL